MTSPYITRRNRGLLSEFAHGLWSLGVLQILSLPVTWHGMMDGWAAADDRSRCFLQRMVAKEVSSLLEVYK